MNYTHIGSCLVLGVSLKMGYFRMDVLHVVTGIDSQ